MGAGAANSHSPTNTHPIIQWRGNTERGRTPQLGDLKCGDLCGHCGRPWGTAPVHAATAMSSVLALVDCRSFYVSVERVWESELRDKPVVVLGNNDSAVVALSDDYVEYTLGLRPAC